MTRSIRSCFRLFLLTFVVTLALCVSTGCTGSGLANFLHGGSPSGKNKKSGSQHDFLEISLNAGIGMSVLLIMAAYPVFKLENAKAGWTCLTTGIIDLILCLWLNTITYWLAWAAGLVLFAVAIWVAVELYRKRSPVKDAEEFWKSHLNHPSPVREPLTLPINSGSIHPGLTDVQAAAGLRPSQVFSPTPVYTPPPLTQP